ncbi:LLM class flavin-dependent oxidoreductase [Streptomyces sp. NPDC048383]|uniref:LLM class flavin-dependent oxidoreductase n=1 Tax=Streptomyces sp. NPDC048383 TaxID=3155386 RepID=UPI003412B26E
MQDPARPPGHLRTRRTAADRPARSRAGGRRLVKFLAITLIADSPDPVTGAATRTRERFRQVVSAALPAEELGFDGFGVGERHERPFLSSSPPVVLAHIAALTREIRPYTAVTTLSLLDPVRAYEDYATLDHLSDGRLPAGVRTVPGGPPGAGRGAGLPDPGGLRRARFGPDRQPAAGDREGAPLPRGVRPHGAAPAGRTRRAHRRGAPGVPRTVPGRGRAGTAPLDPRSGLRGGGYWPPRPGPPASPAQALPASPAQALPASPAQALPASPDP